jgi:hypothetical protein
MVPGLGDLAWLSPSSLRGASGCGYVR